MLFLAILISYILMFDVVCAMFSSFQLLGLWFESIGLTEVDRTQLLLLVVVVVVVVVGCRLWVVGCGLWVVGRRAVLAQGHAGLPQGSFQPLPATLCFSMTCFSSCDQSDDIDSVSVMFRANPA